MNRGFRIAAAVLGFVGAVLFLVDAPNGHACVAGAIGFLAASEL